MAPQPLLLNRCPETPKRTKRSSRVSKLTPALVELNSIGVLFAIGFENSTIPTSSKGWPTMGDKLIFVVDDEPALAEVVAAYLEQSGFAVATFSGSLMALAAAASRKPDLLLSDFKLDGMDGLTLAAKITERYPACKVLIMSGDIHDATTHPELSRFEILQKPIPMARLLEKFSEMLGGD